MGNDYQKLFIALSFGHHLVFGALTHVFVAVAAAVASARSINLLRKPSNFGDIVATAAVSLPSSLLPQSMDENDGRTSWGRKEK